LRLSSRCAVAAFCGAATWACAAPTAHLSQDASGRVLLRYELPAGENVVRFARVDERTHTVVRTPGWKLDPACHVLERGGIGFLAEACKNSGIELQWDDVERDRLYPALVRLQNGGVLVFASYLLATDAERNLVPLVVEAPRGGVVEFRGRKSTSKHVLEAAEFGRDGRAWVYLGPDRFVEESGSSILVDDGVPSRLRQELVDLVPRLVRIYEKRLGPYPAKPSIYLGWNARERPGRSFQADVVPGGVIRFSVTGLQWAEPNAGLLESFRATVAHEVAHLWNGDVAKPASWAAPWVMEGNAELLSVAALVESRAMDAAWASRRVAEAMNVCVQYAMGRAWVRMRERQSGRIPYECGLALHFGIVAAARAHDPSVDAFGFWQALWKRDPVYFEAAMQRQAASVGADKLQALLADILTSRNLPLATALERLQDLGKLAPMDSADIPSDFARAMGASLFSAIMWGDCGGAFGHFQRTDHFEVAQVPAPCGTFRNGMKVRYAAGIDLGTDPMRAAAMARKHCVERSALPMQMVDGAEIIVPCKDAGLIHIFAPLRPDDVSAVLGVLRR
jgi:hypothetical protein